MSPHYEYHSTEWRVSASDYYPCCEFCVTVVDLVSSSRGIPPLWHAFFPSGGMQTKFHSLAHSVTDRPLPLKMVHGSLWDCVIRRSSTVTFAWIQDHYSSFSGASWTGNAPRRRHRYDQYDRATRTKQFLPYINSLHKVQFHVTQHALAQSQKRRLCRTFFWCNFTFALLLRLRCPEEDRSSC